MNNVTDINELQVRDANKKLQTIFALEQRVLMLWLNQFPKMLKYLEAEMYVNLENIKEEMREPIELLQDRKVELDALIDGLKGE